MMFEICVWFYSPSLLETIMYAKLNIFSSMETVINVIKKNNIVTKSVKNRLAATNNEK